MNSFIPGRKVSGQSVIALVGLSCLGLLGNGTAIAQTPATELTIAEPAIAPAPAAPTTAPIPAAPEPLMPEFSLPLPVAPMERPSSSPRATDTYEAPSELVFSERSTGCQTTLSTGQVISRGICEPLRPAESVSGVVRDRQGNATAVSVASLGSGIPGTVISPDLRDYYQRSLRPPGRLGNGNIRLIFPLSLPAVFTSAFGWRIHPISGTQRFHTGTDLAAPLGTPVVAAFAGQVAIADFLGGYGLTVTLQHNKGTQETLYAHLSEIFVRPGESVKQGDVIGRVGSTGNSTGPHLHFEFRQLTPDGWVAMDAGQQLEYGMAQLVQALQVAQAKPAKARQG